MPAEPTESGRFAPHAARTLGGMFDDVSDRYDWLNALLTLGQDRAWRRALAGEVPGEAHAVLDLCTGSGVSLDGLRRPGRLVVVLDVSFGMLGLASGRSQQTGWAPRLVCGDAFHMPFASHSLDAVTVAFGVRNLRPTPDALAEVARVLRPGGTLAILEATAPAPGPFAALHRFHLRRMVPLLGRLSRDPSAYQYLACSILTLSAAELERDLAAAGFAVAGRRSFLMGATRLWAARSSPDPAQKTATSTQRSQNARPPGTDRAKDPRSHGVGETEWRTWTGAQMVVSGALTVALIYGLGAFLKFGDRLPLPGGYRPLALLLLVGGVIAFGARTLMLLARLFGPAGRV